MPPALFSFQGGGFLLSKATTATIDKHDLALHLTLSSLHRHHMKTPGPIFQSILCSSQIAPSLK